MSVKIISKGQPKFIMKCKHCDCKFSYELEDIKTIPYPYIDCPTCGKSCEHSNRERYEYGQPINISYDQVSYNGYDDGCMDCQFYRDKLMNNKAYVGDTPCTWCSKKQVTCSSN